MSKSKFVADVISAFVIVFMGIRLFEADSIMSVPVTMAALLLALAVLLKD